MRKIISVLLIVSMMIGVVNYAVYAEDTEAQYYVIPVEYSDNIGNREYLNVMIKDNNVFVDAKMLVGRFGYNYKENENVFEISGENILNDSLPNCFITFNYNSTQVSNKLYNKIFDTYEAPFKSIKNDTGSWIPFEYSLLLLNSGMLITDDIILIDIPRKNIISYFSDIKENKVKYEFDWEEDFGYTESDEKLQSISSHLVNVLNGLLTFDGSSWKAFFQQFALNMEAYDKKYGENLAILLCTESDKELQATVDKISLLNETFSEDGNLSRVLTSESEMLESQIKKLYEECERTLKDVKDGNSPLVSYNRKYQALEDAFDKQTWFSKTGQNILDVQKGVNDVAGKGIKFLDVASKILEVVGYMQEFENQDEFSLEALKYYLETSSDGIELPNVMKKSMIDYSDLLSSTLLEYTTKRTFEKSVGQWILDEVPIHKALGMQATVMLFCWNLMSNTIPFISNGLSAADNFELALYAQVFQSDTYLNYLRKLNSTFESSDNLTSRKLQDLTKYCYIYLKTCYITREAALATLVNKRDSTKEKIQPLIDYQNDINTEIAKILVELKEANVSDNEPEKLIFGFLPSDNEDYLKKYDDSKLIEWSINYPKNIDTTQTYIDFLKAQEYKSYISDWIYGEPTHYAILDIDDDGIDELIITGGDGTGFYNFTVFSYDRKSKEVYPIPNVYSDVIGNEKEGYFFQNYGGLRYSPSHKALVFSELRTAPMYGELSYFTIKNQELVSDFGIWHEYDYQSNKTTYGYSESGNRTAVDEDEYQNYLNELSDIEFQSIPKESATEESTAEVNIDDYFKGNIDGALKTLKPLIGSVADTTIKVGEYNNAPDGNVSWSILYNLLNVYEVSTPSSENVPHETGAAVKVKSNDLINLYNESFANKISSLPALGSEYAGGINIEYLSDEDAYTFARATGGSYYAEFKDGYVLENGNAVLEFSVENIVGEHMGDCRIEITPDSGSRFGYTIVSAVKI